MKNKLPSSQCPKLIGQTSPSDCLAVFSLFGTVAATLLVTLGCGGPFATASSDRPAPISAASLGPVSSGPATPINISRAPNDKIIIDAGVVFAGHANYICLPFEALGLASDDTVESVVASCECVKGSVLWYRDATDSRKPAMLLSLSSSIDVAEQPVELHVIVTMSLSGNLQREFIVKVIESPVTSEGSFLS